MVHVGAPGRVCPYGFVVPLLVVSEGVEMCQGLLKTDKLTHCLLCLARVVKTWLSGISPAGG